jgi:hypothetical protein
MNGEESFGESRPSAPVAVEGPTSVRFTCWNPVGRALVGVASLRDAAAKSNFSAHTFV